MSWVVIEKDTMPNEDCETILRAWDNFANVQKAQEFANNLNSQPCSEEQGIVYLVVECISSETSYDY